MPPRPPPRWWPMAVCSIPKRSHSSSVWAKSRAVTSTSCPSARIAAISGRMTRTWGLLVRSTQTRTGERGSLLAGRPTGPATLVRSYAADRVDHGSHRQRRSGRRGRVGTAWSLPADGAGERLHTRAQRGHDAVRRLQRVERRVQPVGGGGGGLAGQPGGVVDRLLGGIRRPRGHPREARQEAPHQEEPPGVGRPLVRAPWRRHGVLHPHAPDHPDLHLPPRRSGAHALLALQRCSPWPGACRGC